MSKAMKQKTPQPTVHPTGRFSELTVDRLVIPDRHGKPRIILHVNESGEAIIRVKDGYGDGRNNSVNIVVGDSSDGGIASIDITHRGNTHWVTSVFDDGNVSMEFGKKTRLRLAPDNVSMCDPSGTERMRLTLGTEERDGDDSFNPYIRMLSLHNRLQTDFLSDGVRSESKHGVAWFGLNGRGIPYVNLDAKTNT